MLWTTISLGILTWELCLLDDDINIMAKIVKGIIYIGLKIFIQRGSVQKLAQQQLCASWSTPQTVDNFVWRENVLYKQHLRTEAVSFPKGCNSLKSWEITPEIERVSVSYLVYSFVLVQLKSSYGSQYKQVFWAGQHWSWSSIL